MKLIHIDNSPHGASATSKMLIAGTRDYNNSLIAAQERLDLEGTTFEDFDFQGASREPDSTLFIVTVSESELSRSTVEGEITACRSLVTAQQIASENLGARVFLVPVSNGDTLTALDVVVALLAGISGFVDERGLIMPRARPLISWVDGYGTGSGSDWIR